jgi:hypothetical protein
MTRPNDPPGEMRRFWLDEDTVDRLLTGRIHPDDAPPGYSEVARVLSAFTAAGDNEELALEAHHVALATGLVSRPTSAWAQPDTRAKKTRSRTRLKVGGLVAIGTLLGSTGLAAAGVLPDAAQDAFSNVFDTVGITVPASGNHPATGDHQAGSGNHPASSGEEISEIATTTDATGRDKGAQISSTASGGMSHAGQHGSESAGRRGEGAGAPPVPVPNEGGTATADTASDGASEHGTDTADEKSGGHSSSGSGNASEHAGGPSRSHGGP